MRNGCSELGTRILEKSGDVREMNTPRWLRNIPLIAGCFGMVLIGGVVLGQEKPVASEKIIIDTDIGGDIDDSFAVGLALQSAEFKILGICSATGDTTLRARLVSRLLKETGRTDIPVGVGIAEPGVKHGEGLSQVGYAEGGPANQTYPSAVDFLLEQIKRQPGEITLVAIGPLTNLGAAIDRDAATFRRLKRVVIMGGSVYRGYDRSLFGINSEPSAEYNIETDIPAAQKLFTSGVPLYVMPLDSTQIKLQEVRRAQLVTAGTPVTDAITLM
jgi:inosine-uridine nucleoside N-ribohydrolase